MRFTMTATLVALALSTAACQQSQQPVPTTEQPANAPAPAPTDVTPTITPAATLWFEPAVVSMCDKDPIKVTVHWNARSVSGLKGVEVRPLGPGGKESLFVIGGPVGHRETGVWMTAGRQMVLRDHANGNEIGRARLEGVACP